jgi:hypothetical protein
MPDKTTTGAAGEHYVMYRLLRQGFIAALAPTGVPNADILVTDVIGDKVCAVQVKTRLDPGSDLGWHMGKKHEELHSPNIYYCFVAMETNPPKCWIVPSLIVAKALKVNHDKWLSEPGKNGRVHNDSNVRRFREVYPLLADEYPLGWLDTYLEKWGQLKAAASTDSSPST